MGVLAGRVTGEGVLGNAAGRGATTGAEFVAGVTVVDELTPSC